MEFGQGERAGDEQVVEKGGDGDYGKGVPAIEAGAPSY